MYLGTRHCSTCMKYKRSYCSNKGNNIRICISPCKHCAAPICCALLVKGGGKGMPRCHYILRIMPNLELSIFCISNIFNILHVMPNLEISIFCISCHILKFQYSAFKIFSIFCISCHILKF